MDRYITEFTQMIKLRNLVDNTLNAYISYLRCYLEYVIKMLKKIPEDITWEELRDYILYLIDIKELSPSTINGHISQLRFFHLYVLKKSWDQYQVPYQKVNKYLPDVLSQEETEEFINGINDLKQKAVISLMYSSGLRVSEVVRLKCEDIDRKKMRVRIRESKNRAESFAILSPRALDILEQYWHASDRRRNWLFPGQKGDSHITAQTVRVYVKNRTLDLGWNRKINCHQFRHAFGCHLYQNGVDLLTIQKLLRHKSIHSTTLYVHLNFTGFKMPKSPFDLLPGGTR